MSIADPWAVTDVTGGGPPPVEPLPEHGTVQRARGRLPHWLAAFCFAGIAVLNLVWAFQPFGDGLAFGRQHEYDFPVVAAENSGFFLAAAACAVLLVVPRTRAFARSFGIGFSAIWFATDFMALHIPQPEILTNRLSEWCVVAADALALPALIFLLWAARSQARAANVQPAAATTETAEAETATAETETAAGTAAQASTETPASDDSDSDSAAPQPAAPRPAKRWSPALGLGIVGAALWIVGDVLAWIRITVPADFLDPDAKPTSVTCCGFTGMSTHGKIGVICGAAVLLLLVVLAGSAVGRRGGRNAYGLLAGVLPPLGAHLLSSTVEITFPREAQFGLQNPLLTEARQFHSADAFLPTSSPVLGFWLALAGFAVLAAVMTHLAVRRARAVD